MTVHRHIFTLFLGAFLAITVAGRAPAEGLEGIAQWQADPSATLEATEVETADFLWQARPLVIFADTEADPAFARQMDMIRARMDALTERDVAVIVDTDPAAGSQPRRALRPRGFALILLGKDGNVMLRKPSPWDVREISRAIDKTPERQQELRDRRTESAAE